MDTILDIIGALSLSIAGFYAWSKLLNKKINLKDYKFYLSVILLSFVTIINYSSVNTMIRVVFIILFMAFIIKFMFKVSLKTSIVTAFYTQLINLISELVYSIAIVLMFNISTGTYPVVIIFFANIFITISLIFLVRIKLIQKLYKTIIKYIEEMSLKIVLLCFLPICFIFNVYLAITYYNYNPVYYIIINIVSIYIIVGIILILIKKENDYSKIYDKYNTTLNSLKEYEDILDKYRVSNHENKNQLLTIRNMITDKNKKVAKYIDELVKNKIKDDERIMQEASIIPAGGLRGLIYSKILYMKELKIEYELNISKDIRTVDLINKLDDSDMLDICQIIGVYIDNAIEAVSELEEKYVNIELYLEKNNLIFEVSNYYEGNIELDKLEQKGYTTKSSGHGYGLSLTKEIIDNNKKLKNEKRLSKEIFTQVLKIKMK